MTAPIVPPTGRNPAGSGQRAAARDHVTRLRQDGGTYRSIAAAAALSPAAVRGLASGRRRTQPGTAAAVLTVTSRSLPRARLDATGTRLRLRALHVMGHGSARIARAAGVSDKTIRKLVAPDHLPGPAAVPRHRLLRQRPDDPRPAPVAARHHRHGRARQQPPVPRRLSLTTSMA